MTADKETPLAISCHPRLYRSPRLLRPNAKQKDMGECYRVPHSTQDSGEPVCRAAWKCHTPQGHRRAVMGPTLSHLSWDDSSCAPDRLTAQLPIPKGVTVILSDFLPWCPSWLVPPNTTSLRRVFISEFTFGATQL